MGSCLSKKSTSASPHSAGSDLDSPNQSKLNSETEKKAEGEIVKKAVHVIKNRMGTDEEKGGLDRKATCPTASQEPNVSNTGITGSVMCGGGMGLSNGCNAVVRTSSCTKEEVDAILIQCGRLSRSSSTGKAALSGSGDDSGNPHRSRNYSGCKRSYDFEHEAVRGIGMEDKGENGNVVYGDDGETDAATIHRHRQSQRQSQRQRQSRASSSPSHGRRRTPSREREHQQQQQRSGNGSGGRRVSRSPGRRSEPPTTTINGVSDAAPSSANARCGSRPGKMVSVPATVTSFATDKSNNGAGGGAEPQPPATTIKRISLKRSSGDSGIGSRTAASPRSRSPARANAWASTQNQDVHLNQHQQQPLSLSWSNSRKAEQSPCRRNPLTEINPNIIGFEKQTMPSNNILPQKPNTTESVVSNKVIVQGTSNKNGTPKGASDMGIAVNCRAKEQQLVVEEAKAVQVVQPMNRDITVTAVAAGGDNLEHQTIGRARSARQSRDLDFDPEAVLSPTTSYTALLLEDIQSFHQMSTTTLSLPPCLTKACSILEAVADLNSSTSSIPSSTLAEERSRGLPAEQFKNSSKFGTNVVGNRRAETKEPFLESEVVVANDLIEPSLHKYVTMRGTVGAGDTEEQESSGSNSLVGGSYHWISSSLEPGSADSTDCWTTSRHSARDNNRSSLGF